MLFRGKCIGCGRRTQRTKRMGGYYGAIGARYFWCRACDKASPPASS